MRSWPLVSFTSWKLCTTSRGFYNPTICCTISACSNNITASTSSVINIFHICNSNCTPAARYEASTRTAENGTIGDIRSCLGTNEVVALFSDFIVFIEIESRYGEISEWRCSGHYQQREQLLPYIQLFCLRRRSAYL